jgi:hypothetical protein
MPMYEACQQADDFVERVGDDVPPAAVHGLRPRRVPVERSEPLTQPGDGLPPPAGGGGFLRGASPAMGAPTLSV